VRGTTYLKATAAAGAKKMFVRMLVLALCSLLAVQAASKSKVLIGLQDQLAQMEDELNKIVSGIEDKADADEKAIPPKDINEINVASGGHDDDFEEDMKLTPEQRLAMKQSSKGWVGRNGDAIKSTRSKWPATKGANGKMTVNVPYFFAAGFVGKDTVKSALQHISEKVTCIKFQETAQYPSSRGMNQIKFFHDRGCYSYVGRVNMYPQPISLQRGGCVYKGIAVHEVMHALGYFHEQSRPDRDNFITIVTANIQAGMARQFAKMDTNAQGTAYDYGSVMHYGAKAFSKNGRDTIVRKDGGTKLGQRVGLSAIDAQQLRIMYCGEAEPGVATTPKAITTTTTRKPYTTPSTAPPPPPPTRNNKKWCMAAQQAGLCRFCNVSNVYCKDQCVDKSKWCPAWSSRFCAGEGRYTTYMHRNCAASCRADCIKPLSIGKFG